MISSPLFTVFTPTYNRASTLHRPYLSLYRQTVHNFEWLIIDDGSTDNTREVVEVWRREADFDIRYIFQPNASKAAAWNRALSIAEGVFFVCLDSDDECVPYALERFKELWDEVPLAQRSYISCISVLCVNQEGQPCGPDLPIERLCATLPEFLFRFNCAQDTWECYRTEVVRAYPFELIDGYRGLLPESTFMNRLSLRYQQLYINERLRIYHLEDAPAEKHLSSGVGTQLRSAYRPGYRKALLSYIRGHSHLAVYAPLRYFKMAANYVGFSLGQGIGIRQQAEEIGQAVSAKLLWIAMLPAGLILYLRDRLLGL